jgi:hypothetical protein
MPLDRRYTLDRDYTYQSGILGRAFVGVRDGREWLQITPDGAITVRAGFEFDGSTFSPDGRRDRATGKPRMYYPALVHDALYVFLPHTPFSRREIDDIFLRMMREAGFRPAWLYFGMVRALGGVFVKVTR